MAKIVVHIGYPKCLSTTLQRNFFEKHPQLNYGGVGIGDNISYTTEGIEFIFELLLKYSRRDFYKTHRAKAREEIEKFLDKNRLNVFSSEHLIMNFILQGIDPEEKMSRLKDLFEGHDVTILVIHRSREKIIRSLYGEFVRMGYYKKFKDFLLWVEKFQDRNFYYDLDLSNVKKRVKKYFKKIIFIEFESLVKDANIAINDTLSSLLEINNLSLPIRNENPSLSIDEVEQLRRYNEKNQRELGEDALTAFEHHRNRTLFSYLGLQLKETDVFYNVLQKRKALTEYKITSHFDDRNLNS